MVTYIATQDCMTSIHYIVLSYEGYEINHADGTYLVKMTCCHSNHVDDTEEPSTV